MKCTYVKIELKYNTKTFFLVKQNQTIWKCHRKHISFNFKKHLSFFSPYPAEGFLMYICSVFLPSCKHAQDIKFRQYRKLQGKETAPKTYNPIPEVCAC